MDSILNTLSLWREAGVFIAAVLVGVVLIHYIAKLWTAPIDAILGLILGASVVVTGGMITFAHFSGFGLSSRAFWFVALYIWCVLGMLFFAARQTHRGKLLLGLISQAGILYALFIWL